MEFTYITDQLLSWYFTNKRPLPWRETNDPYHIWLSEIILQQTRVGQGLPYYERFVEKFPSVFDLSSASEDEVLLLWQGLGYYSRARNLHKCARKIVSEYHGQFPKSYAALIKLPGIGPYTAAAIASICYKESKPVLDGNVFRVLSRLFDIKENISTGAGKKYFETIAKNMIPETDPGDFNQAIMEFGALQCTPVNPDCISCIMNSHCLSYKNNSQHERPVKEKRNQKVIRHFNYLVLENELGLYLKKRRDNDIWQGLYDFHLIESSKPGKSDLPSSVNPILRKTAADIQPAGIRHFKHVLTHQIIYACFHHIRLKTNGLSGLGVLLKGGKFYPLDEIMKLPKPVLIDKYLKEEIF
jgi:A/G-specific adenine glycosylase